MTSRVGWMDGASRYTGGIRVSDESRVQMVPLDDAWRKAFIIHKHEIEDGSFYDGRSAGMIHGVGLRTRVYWPWWFKQKINQWAMEFIERFALGIQIWYYEHGNPESEAQVRAAAEEFSSENVILFPRPIGTEKQGPGYERIEPGTGGIQFFFDLLDNYWGKMIRKMIIGQELTSETAPTGLGSEVAKVHKDTFTNIIRYDALNLEETLTHEYLKVLAEYNYPGIEWKPRLELIIKEPDPKPIMEAAKMVADMGGNISEEELMKIAGLTRPEEGEKTLGRSAMMPGQQPGMIPQGGPQPSPFGFDREGNPLTYQQWITIGGSPKGGKQHVGGTPVYIEKGGQISKGPSKIEGKNIKTVDKDIRETQEEKRPKKFRGRDVPRKGMSIQEMEEIEDQDWWKKTLNKLDDEQKNILSGYTSDDAFEEYPFHNYVKINEALRKGRPLDDTESEIVSRLEEAINEHPLPEGTIVYRGVTIGDIKNPDDLINFLDEMENLKGDTIEFESFTSTSLNFSIATDFTHQKQNVIYEIKPKHGVYVNPLSETEGEQEVVLNKNKRYKVVDVLSEVQSDIKEMLDPDETRKFTVIQLEEV